MHDTQPAASSSSSGWPPCAWWQSSSWSITSKWCERRGRHNSRRRVRRGTEEMSESGIWLPATNGSWRLLFLSVLSSPVIVHAKVMEVSSTRQGEEKRPEAGSWQREETIHVNSTPQFARVTHANTFACGSSGAHASQLALFCVISHDGHPHKLISCRTRNVHGFTAFFFHFRTALHLRFVLLKGVSVTIRNMAFSLAVLPNSAP